MCLGLTAPISPMGPYALLGPWLVMALFHATVITEGLGLPYADLARASIHSHALHSFLVCTLILSPNPLKLSFKGTSLFFVFSFLDFFFFFLQVMLELMP